MCSSGNSRNIFRRMYSVSVNSIFISPSPLFSLSEFQFHFDFRTIVWFYQQSFFDFISVVIENRLLIPDPPLQRWAGCRDDRSEWVARDLIEIYQIPVAFSIHLDISGKTGNVFYMIFDVTEVTKWF